MGEVSDTQGLGREVLKGSLRGIGDLNKSFYDGVYDILNNGWLRRPKRRGKITRVSIPGAH